MADSRESVGARPASIIACAFVLVPQSSLLSISWPDELNNCRLGSRSSEERPVTNKDGPSALTITSLLTPPFPRMKPPMRTLSPVSARARVEMLSSASPLTVGVGVAEGFPVGVGLAVGVAEGVGVTLGVGMMLGVGVALGVGVGLGVGLIVGVSVTVGVIVGVGVTDCAVAGAMRAKLSRRRTLPKISEATTLRMLKGSPVCSSGKERRRVRQRLLLHRPGRKPAKETRRRRR